MSELNTIIETVKNQVEERQEGCLSMRSERLLVGEIARLRAKAEYWQRLAERKERPAIPGEAGCGQAVIEPWRDQYHAK